MSSNIGYAFNGVFNRRLPPVFDLSLKIGMSAWPSELWNVALNKEKRILGHVFRRGSSVETEQNV